MIEDDPEALKAALIQARAEAAEAAADLAAERAGRASDQAWILSLQLHIEKLKRTIYGQRSERSARLLDQLELQLEEAEASAAQDALAAESAADKRPGADKTTQVGPFTRKRPVRKPFPEHLPVERVVLPGPTACPCCGGERLHKLGEDTTKTLESVPRTWKVIEYVREKFSCRDCETITQPPAPFHVIARGWAGPSLLAMIAYEKFAQHKPLNRQAEQYASEGVPLSLSTLADQVGSVCTVLDPLFERLEGHVFACVRVHADDTPVKVLAKGKTETARLWDYVRDDRPFGGQAAPAVVFYYSRDRAGVHPQAHLANWAGFLQADAYAGYTKLFEPDRSPGVITEAACWSHSRRKFFELADIEAQARKKAQGKSPKFVSPMALEAVQRIDALFAIEREINGLSPDERKAVRQAQSKPLVDALKAWFDEQRPKLSKSNDVAKAMDYMLNRWASFCAFLDDGRICLSNNAAERAIRSIAVGRKSWLFFGSDRGGQRAAKMYSFFVTCKLNNVDGFAWLADVLARIADHPAKRLDELLPWNWKPRGHEEIQRSLQAA
jgi:transposase